MGKILITAGEDIIARNILFTDFLPSLKREYSGEIIIAVKPTRIAYMREALPEYTFVSFSRQRSSVAERIIGWALLKASNTETMQWLTWNAYHMGIRSLWKVYADRLYERFFGRSRWLKKLLRHAYLRTGCDQYAEELLKSVVPDAVIALSLTNFDFDIPIAREARRSGIRLIAMVRSWDALVTHGALRVVPDAFMLQNEFLRKTAQEHQALPLHLLKQPPLGLPHYDAAVRGDLETREETFARVGLDPAKRLILYCAMGDSFRYESKLQPFFDTMLAGDELPSDVQFLYRPHPATSKLGRRDLVPSSNVIIDPTVGFVNESNPREDAKGAIARHFLSLVAHADVVMTAGSTVALDAAALHRPTICINFEPPSVETPFWLSVRAVYAYFTHFIDYVKTGAADVVMDANALPDAINEVLREPGKRRAGIDRAIAEFLAPHDGNAGKRLAERVLSEIRAMRT
jgi:hypothetical protein